MQKRRSHSQDPDGSPSDPVIADVDTRDGPASPMSATTRWPPSRIDHADGSHLTYLMRVAGIDGNSRLDGYADYLKSTLFVRHSQPPVPVDGQRWRQRQGGPRSAGGWPQRQLSGAGEAVLGRPLASVFAPQLDLVSLKTNGDHTDEVYRCAAQPGNGDPVWSASPVMIPRWHSTTVGQKRSFLARTRTASPAIP